MLSLSRSGLILSLMPSDAETISPSAETQLSTNPVASQSCGKRLIRKDEVRAGNREPYADCDEHVVFLPLTVSNEASKRINFAHQRQPRALPGRRYCGYPQLNNERLDMHAIMTSQVLYDADGLHMAAHLARPQGEGPWPAVLIGHDGVGLDDYQRGRAEDLAAHGYIALAMDFHGGQTFFGRPDAMLARVMPLLADAGRMRAIGRVALDVLLATPDVDANWLFALGYGAGGHIVLELAKTGAPFKAIAVVHPSLPEPAADDWRDLTSTVLLCTGSEDPLCTPAQLLAFGHGLQGAGVDWRVNVYGVGSG